MTPEEIHRLRLAEVARVATALQAINTRVGYPGTLAQVQKFLRSDAGFRLAPADALGDGYRDIGPRPPWRGCSPPPRRRHSRSVRCRPTSKGPTPARYMDGSLASGRPGISFFNTRDLRSRFDVREFHR